LAISRRRALHWIRICDGAAQRTDRHAAAAGRTPRPKHGDGSDRRALPGSRFPSDKHPLSGVIDFGIVQRTRSVVQSDGKATVSFRDFDAANGITAFRSFQGIK
jgi:hypothetical protein